MREFWRFLTPPYFYKRMGLRDHIAFLRSLTPDKQEEKIVQIMFSLENEIVDANQFQLLEGKYSDGGFVEPPYRNPSYARRKLMMNPNGVVDLRLTGAFHNSFFMQPTTKFPISIFATDPKTKSLLDKYGGKDKIFGLNQEGRDHVIKYHLLPEIQTLYKSILQLP